MVMICFKIMSQNLPEEIDKHIPNHWARGYCCQIWCMLIGHCATFNKAVLICFASNWLHRILETNWNIWASRVFALFTFCFNPQDGGESGSRVVECTFREVGCLVSVHPDELATHLDTQIHYHTSVSATSKFCVAQNYFITGQCTKCAVGKALWKKERRNISLNYALVLEEIVAQNCHRIQNFQS
jgi:hypothetical protein